MSTRTIDLASGLVVTAIGTAGLVESLRMPRFEERGVDPNTVPGLTPGILSAALLVLGLMLTLRAARGRGTGAGVTLGDWNRTAVLRMALTLVCTLGYGMLLFGNVPFLLATVLFVFVFTVAVEWVNPERKMPFRMLIPAAFVLALVSGAGIEFIFREIFLVRLPG